MTTTKPVTDNWKKEWFEIEDAAYLKTANHAAMPRVSLRAVQASLEAKNFPHHADAAFFEVPIRLRASIARLIGSKPEEIALTTGASPSVAAVAHGLAARLAGRRFHLGRVWRSTSLPRSSTGQTPRKAHDRGNSIHQFGSSEAWG